MEKINLEKVRGHLAALNKELGVKALDEDVIELLGDYIHDFIYRKIENISITNYLSDYDFSINYQNQIEVDDVYQATDEIKTRGGKIIRDAGPMNAGTTIIAFVEDPDGYQIELIGKKH